MKQLQGLLAFVEAASAGSLAAAAERLELTPAAVSKSLAKLEAQLGVRLLQRSTRRLALTAEGERFLDKARLALRALDEAVADVTQSATEASGRVRISVGHAFGRQWVLPLLPPLRHAHPGLAIELDLDNRPVDLLAEGYDIGIRGGFIADSSLVARRICALPVALLASPAYLKRAGVPRTVDELKSHDCVAVRFAGQALVDGRLQATGTHTTLAADQVFLAIGQTPDTPLLAGTGLALDGGRIVADDDGHTSVPGLYAGGDCRRGGRDLTVAAVEDGKRAAAAIHAHLSTLPTALTPA